MTSIQRGLLPIGSGERIRTTDLRVMSPTSYHCSTPRCRWRTDLVSHKATLQYLQRWSVSRPGSGWDGVGPLRFMHANGSELDMNELRMLHVEHVPDLPSGKPSAMRTGRLHMSPCFQLQPLIPVIFWGPYLTFSVSTLILGGISHLDAFSGSYVQT